MKAHYFSKPAACLRVSGEDAAAFLQSQATQDLNMAQGSARYTLWLNHQGRIEGDAFVLRISEQMFVLYSYASTADGLLAKLNRHIIADDVQLEDLTSCCSLLSIAPMAAADWLSEQSLPLAAGEFASLGRADEAALQHDIRVLRGSRLGHATLDVLTLGELPPLAPAGAALSLEDAELLRLQAGIPLIPLDLDAECTPLAGGVLHAISFTKGCYLGQEVVARLSRLQRSGILLKRFRADRLVQPQSTVLAGDLPAGLIRSSASDGDGCIGLLTIKARFADASPVCCGTALHLLDPIEPACI